MTTALFLFVPLNPRVIGGEPIPPHHVLKLWLIQILFEAIIPEVIIAVVSQRWSREGKFGDVTAALKSFDRSHLLVVAFVVVIWITDTHWNALSALCAAPRDLDGGGGLLSFSACCPYLEPGWNTTRYGEDEEKARRRSCWMDQHYPATCDGLTGPGAKWSWGEPCTL